MDAQSQTPVDKASLALFKTLSLPENLTEDQKTLLQKLTHEFLAFNKTLVSESDRGCALFATSYLDVALANLLRRSLVEDSKMDEFFNNSGPLGTFSSRIGLAFYMGMISSPCRRDLDMLRSIRNKFAHSAEALTFDTHAIQQQANSLKFRGNVKGASARNHFESTACCILGRLHSRMLYCTRPNVLPDDTPTKEMEQEAQRLSQRFNDLIRDGTIS